mgnify:CR=1 FL=1
MVVTNDETLFDRSVHFKGQGLAKHRQYWHDVVGYNSKVFYVITDGAGMGDNVRRLPITGS